MICHITALLAGCLLDLIFKDPRWKIHPIRLIGQLISFVEKKTLADGLSPEEKLKRGLYLVIIVTLLPVTAVYIILYICYRVSPLCGICAETVLTFFALAAGSLSAESMKVYKALKKGDLEESRKAVSMIVGRDTAELDEEGVTKAAVETVAENTSDGVIAPLLYLALGGPVLGYLYKSINTMDSMVGYKNDRYIDYGRYAALLDDIANYIPARISAYIMIMACRICGKSYDAKEALRIFKRDRYNHASPNSAQTESVMAGALGIRLAGPASYFGKRVDKPFIGDSKRAVETEDIKRANVLMYATDILCILISVVILCMAEIFTGMI